MLLAAGTSQQLNGQELLPNVPYLTMLDQFYFANVCVIWAIAIETIFLALMVGIERTVSNMTTIESIPLALGAWEDADALAFEATFLWLKSRLNHG